MANNNRDFSCDMFDSVVEQYLINLFVSEIFLYCVEDQKLNYVKSVSLIFAQSVNFDLKICRGKWRW